MGEVVNLWMLPEVRGEKFLDGEVMRLGRALRGEHCFLGENTVSAWVNKIILYKRY